MKTSLIALIGSVAALQNVAPALIISGTRELPSTNASSVSSFDSALEGAVEHCEYQNYVFATVPGVSEREVNIKSMPELGQLLEKSADYQKLAIYDSESVSRNVAAIQDKCGAQIVKVGTDGAIKSYSDAAPRLFKLELSSDVAKADKSISNLLGHLNSGDFLLAVNLERDTINATDATGEASKSKSNLFTDYIFFSPGIFMGLIVSVSVVSLTVIALGWLQSLMVSYKAFEKQEKDKQS